MEAKRARTNMDSGDSLINALFAKYKEQWEKSTHSHSFLEGCADGKTTRAQFDTWLTQDFIYVAAFKVFLAAAMKVAPAEDLPVLEGGMAAVDAEYLWFQRKAKERSLDLNVAPLTAMTLYETFLLSLGHLSYAYQVTALYVIEQLYYDAWSSVMQRGGPTGPYSEFATNWSNEAFREYCVNLGKISRKAIDAEGLHDFFSAQRFDFLFAEICRLEIMFWDMAYAGPTVVTKEAPRAPLPPFTYEAAVKKVRAAEDAWNTKDPLRVSLAYTLTSKWRNRSEFLNGRKEIVGFLSRKWQKERDYKLIKEIWAHSENRIAVRFAYEWRDADDNWFRSHGNENWEFDADGYMAVRHASINDVRIKKEDRKFTWPDGPRPADFPGLTELGL
jgi:uncharacterized protein